MCLRILYPQAPTPRLFWSLPLSASGSPRQTAGKVMGKTGCVVLPSRPLPSSQGACPVPFFQRHAVGPPCHLLPAAPAVPALANVSQPCRQSTSRKGRQCRSEHQPVSLSCSHTAWCQQAIHSTYSFPGLANLEISISVYPGRRPK